VYDHPSLEPEDLPRPTSRRKLPSNEDFQNWEIEGMRVVKMVFESNGGL